MDDTRVGLMIRSIRRRHGLRQADLAAAAGSSRSAISRIESGDLNGASVRLLRAISRSLDMPPIVSLGSRSPEVAQLLDERHAAIVEIVVRWLRGKGWEPLVEYSFSHFGERGSVDVAAWHPATETLLIVEVKTRIVDLQDLFSTLDRKRRLVPMLLASERGWRPAALGVLLVVPATSTVRAAMRRHAETFASVLPARTVAVRHWLAAPAGALRGVWFVQDSRPGELAARRSA